MTKSRVAWPAAVVVFIVHAIGNAHYGFFRDELYFIICGEHPQFGYVDQPPLVPLLAALTQLGGHSLWLLRAVPALFAAGGAYVTCLLAAELGGGVFAEALAALAFLFCGVLLSFGGKVGTDEVGLLTWPLIALLILRVVRGAHPRLWLWVGLLAGISFESKYSIVFYLVAAIAGLLATPQRRAMWNWWFAAGTGIMLALALPNVAWQAHNGFPMWELLRNGQSGKNVIVGPGVYVIQEILITNPFLFPVWAIGLVALLRDRTARFLGIAYIVLIVEMMVLHGKHYYPADIYPILFAAGAAAIGRWTVHAAGTRAAILAYTLVLGPAFLPLSLPVLPVPQFLSYEAKLGEIMHLPKGILATEHGRDTTALPGDYADMHGWPQLAARVKTIYDTLPAAERAHAVVFGGNYGEAAAIAFFDPGIPVIGTHNQYWLWGPAPYEGNATMIQINGTCWAAERYFRSRTIATRFDVPWTVAWETNIPINLCRGLKVPVATLWDESKLYE